MLGLAIKALLSIKANYHALSVQYRSHLADPTQVSFTPKDQLLLYALESASTRLQSVMVYLLSWSILLSSLIAKEANLEQEDESQEESV